MTILNKISIPDLCFIFEGIRDLKKYPLTNEEIQLINWIVKKFGIDAILKDTNLFFEYF